MTGGSGGLHEMLKKKTSKPKPHPHAAAVKKGADAVRPILTKHRHLAPKNKRHQHDIEKAVIAHPEILPKMKDFLHKASTVHPSAIHPHALHQWTMANTKTKGSK